VITPPARKRASRAILNVTSENATPNVDVEMLAQLAVQLAIEITGPIRRCKEPVAPTWIASVSALAIIGIGLGWFLIAH